MKIIIIPVGFIGANCYIVYDEETKEALVIDPGEEGEKICTEIQKKDLQVKYIVNTHGHGDHIGANGYVKEVTGAVLAIHREDAPMLTDAAKNMSLYMPVRTNGPAADLLLKDGDTLEVGKMIFTVLHTPGHSRGGICLVSGKACFSGDTLFQYSIGRTDLPGGSYPELISSITDKLLALDENTTVFPGHGGKTTIGAEKSGNPFLN
ncbi:MAG: MBL fold metallo-hydrolase [Clostridia bacterium]|nr:MBL fold metallo-hydrolase [Clostridia bacterium]